MIECAVQEAVASIVDQGYYVLRDAVNLADLVDFAAAYENVFRLEPPQVHTVTLDNGHLYNVHHSTLRKFTGFEALLKFFDAEKLRDVVHAYMNLFFDYPRNDVHEVFEVEHNFKLGSTNGSPLHFDMVPSLKTFIYLDRTTRDNGAVRVLPGSHVPAREFALRALQQNPNPLVSDSFLSDAAAYEQLHLEGEPGTIIFLDTYCLHGGGILSGNRPRRSVRAVSWARPLHQHYFVHPVFNRVEVNPNYQKLGFYNPCPVTAELPPHDLGSMYREI
ncbi:MULTISPECIES: phytanoyl-CoA dioxygenase family protein [Methylomonas]|uniref:phytanoyl-CoA dioxygenase family protein n=1 Tax=Methylomonas TaxID=416 RepID=UPI001231B1DF|nr:phytanoyl-CoA dioxygenase family protein [Methylomonas rhizoryzae]